MPQLHDVESIASFRGGALRILGLPGSGRTRALVARWRSLRAEGVDATLVTWGAPRRDALVERVVDDGAAVVGPPPVQTWTSVSLAVLREAGERFVGPLSELQEHALLSTVLERVRLRSDYARVSHSPTLRGTLLTVLHALVQNAVAAERARELADSDDGAIGARARDILRLYAAWREALDSAGAVTFLDLAWRAAACVERDASLAARVAREHVLVDDFHDADAGQWALLRALVPPGGERGVTVAGDPTLARYAYRGTSASFLLEHFPRTYACTDAVLPLPEVLRDERLAPLLDAVRPAVAPGDAPTREGDEAPELEAFTAVDEAAEAREIARRAAQCIDGGVSPARIAVIARRPARVRARVRAAFDEQGVALSAASPLSDALADLALSVVEALAGNVPRSARLATLPGFDALCEAFAAGEASASGETTRAGKADAASGEAGAASSDPDARTSATGRARGGASSAEGGAPARSTAPGAAGVGDDPDEALDETSARRIERLVARLRERFEREDGLDVASLVDAVAAATAPALGAEAPRAFEGVRALRESWRRYCEVRRPARRDAGEFAALCRRWTSLERAGEPGGVALVSPHEAGARRWDVVFVAGLVDGEFPTRTREPGYVPWRALAEALADAAPDLVLGGARDPRESDRLEYALLLDAVTRARRRLVLSAPRSSAGAEAQGPPPALARAFAAAPPEACDPPAPAWALADALACVHRTGASQALSRAARERLRAGETLWALPRPSSPSVAVPTMPMSASAVDAWVACPRRFFYRYGLRLREPDSLASEAGRIVHEVVERLGAEHRDRAAFARAVEGDEGDAVALALEARSGALDGRGLAARLVPRAVREALRRVANIERARRDGTSIEHVEWQGSFRHAGVDLQVRVDRVDVGEATIVVDYKTGKLQHKGADTVAKYAARRDAPAHYWQVPFYLGFVRAQIDRWPDAFWYYVLGGDAERVVGVCVDRPGFTLEGVDGRFTTITSEEAEAMLDAVVEIAREAIEPHAAFGRAESESPCTWCAFRAPCRRRGRS